MGIEPERVFPLRKQCSTLFSGKRAERFKRGQLAFAAGKGGDSHHLLQKIQRSSDLCIFLFEEMGIEPERVAALDKQSGGLFVASESLSGSESQLALAFGKNGDSHHLFQKNTDTF